MRLSPTLLAAALLTSAAAQATEHWRMVDRSGRVIAIDERSELPESGGEGLVRVWYWSAHVEPQQGELRSFHGELPPTPEHLEVRVAGPREEHRDLELIAAPTAMWLDVPEPLLPRWSVPERGEIRLPRSPGEAWRLRLQGKGEGSWWIDLPAGQREVLIESSQAADDLEVEVLDSYDESVPEGVLRLFRDGDGVEQATPFLAHFRSNEARFLIPGLPSLAKVSAVISAAESVPVSFLAWPHTFPRRVHLRRGSVVAGRFVTDAGKPVAGAKVLLESWVSERFPRPVHLFAESDADGRWRIASVPLGSTVVLARAPGFARFHRLVEITEQGLDMLELVLEPGAALIVEVVSESGEPLSGALVRARGGHRAVTDAEGRADLGLMSASRPVQVEVDAERYLPAKKAFDPAEGGSLRIRLDPAFVVHGRYVGAGGVGVEDAMVTVVAGHSSRDQPIAASGRFELELKPEKKYQLSVVAPTTLNLEIELEPGVGGEVRDLGDLVAAEGASVTGWLISAATGEAVAGARVWTPRAPGPAALASWFHGDLLEAASDSEGRFVLRGLAFGQGTRLSIDAPGFARRQIEVRLVPEESSVELGELELAAGATVRVVSDGSVEDGAIARVDLGRRWLENEMLTAPVFDGEAILPHVPAGPALLTIVAGREVLCEEPVNVPAEDTDLEVECLAASMHVSGVVRMGESRVGLGNLTWMPPAPENMGIIHRRVSPAGLSRANTYGAGRPQVDVEVGVDGYFSTDDLRSGRWEVVWLPAGGGSSEPQTVELSPADEVEIRLDFPGHSITGTVTDLEGRAVDRARVRELVSGGLVFSDAGGNFRFVGLEAGARYLKAELDGQTSRIVQVEILPDAEPESVELILGEEKLRRRIALRVIGSDDQPVAGALVFFDSEIAPIRILTAGSDGTAEVEIEPPLPTRIRFAVFAGGTWQLGAWSLWDAENEEPMTLSLPANGTLVLTSDHDPAYVAITSQDGWDVSRLLTRVGSRPVAGIDRPLRVHGLPIGRYTVSQGTETVGVRIEEARESEVGLRN